MLPPYVCTHIHIRTGTYTHNGKFQCGVFASRHFCTSQKLVHTHCNCAPSKSSNSVYPFSLKNFSYFHTYTHTNTCTGEQCTRQLQRYFFYKLNPYVRRYPLPHKHFPQRLLIWNYHFLQWKRSIVLGNGIQPPLVVFPYVFHRYSELYFLFFFSFFFLPFRGNMHCTCRWMRQMLCDAKGKHFLHLRRSAPYRYHCACLPVSCSIVPFIGQLKVWKNQGGGHSLKEEHYDPWKTYVVSIPQAAYPIAYRMGKLHTPILRAAVKDATKYAMLFKSLLWFYNRYPYKNYLVPRIAKLYFNNFEVKLLKIIILQIINCVHLVISSFLYTIFSCIHKCPDINYNLEMFVWVVRSPGKL